MKRAARVQDTTRIAIALIAAPLFVVAVLLDNAATFLGWVSPAWLFVSVGGALVLSVVQAAWMLGRGAGAAATALGLSMLAGAYLWPMTPRKLFFRDGLSIHVGGSRAEAERIAARWNQGHPFGLDVWFCDPHLCFHHGQGGQSFSSDYCVVEFDGDRVSSVALHYD